jgi:hypothetical protein
MSRRPFSSPTVLVYRYEVVTFAFRVFQSAQQLHRLLVKMSKRPSPDSVLVIDLTLEEDQEKRLGDVRKELEPPVSKKKKKRAPAGLKTTGLDGFDDDEVIVLEDAPGAEVNAPGAEVKLEGDKAGRSKTNKISTTSSNGSDDDVQIVAPSTPKLVPTTARTPSAKNDDDVVIAGVLNEQRLPHNRHDCTVYPFVRSKWGGSAGQCNSVAKLFCDLCYCYVCDCPAKDCKSWCLPTLSLRAHCFAHDVHPWTRMRADKLAEYERSGRPAVSVAMTPTSALPPTEAIPPPQGFHYMDNPCMNRPPHASCCEKCWCFVCDKPGRECPNYWNHCIVDRNDEKWIKEREQRQLSTYGKEGPFAPDTEDAPKDDRLTKCRRCGWFSHLSGRKERLSSPADWCKQCGRVASEQDFRKLQRKEPTFKPPVDLKNPPVSLGIKEIPFRIKAHDPRRFPEYERHWKEADPSSSEWLYDEVDREEEVFLHRIGEKPHVQVVSHHIPRYPEDKVCVFPGGLLKAEQTDHILVDNVQHIQLLHSLASVSEETTFTFSASWDRVARSGVSCVVSACCKFFAGIAISHQKHLLRRYSKLNSFLRGTTS